MAIITCKDNCIYQIDGYCRLEIPSVITNDEKDSCVHRICPNEDNSPSTNCIKCFSDSTNPNDLNL